MVTTQGWCGAGGLGQHTCPTCAYFHDVCIGHSLKTNFSQTTLTNLAFRHVVYVLFPPLLLIKIVTRFPAPLLHTIDAARRHQVGCAETPGRACPDPGPIHLSSLSFSSLSFCSQRTGSSRLHPLLAVPPQGHGCRVSASEAGQFCSCSLIPLPPWRPWPNTAFFW